jgi:hypothetical protein
MSTFLGSDGLLRCGWSGAAPEFITYHDTEWGFPVSDDQRLFEKLSLDGPGQRPRPAMLRAEQGRCRTIGLHPPVGNGRPVVASQCSDGTAMMGA